MPDDPQAQPGPPPKPRKKAVNLRIDEELHAAANKKARPYGGLSAVIRAMLRAFVSGERNFDLDDLADENTPSPKPKPTRRRRR